MPDTNQDTHEIRREIDDARADIQETIDALEHRLSPTEVLDRVWSRVRHGGGAAVGGALRAHPIPTALLGTGLVWLALGIARRNAAAAALHLEDDKRHHATWDLAGATTYGELDGYGDGEEWRGDGDHRLARVGRSLRSTTVGRPLAVGAVALGLGLVAGLAIPGSRWEDRLRQSPHDVPVK
jgi:hypothetical protein